MQYLDTGLRHPHCCATTASQKTQLCCGTRKKCKSLKNKIDMNFKNLSIPAIAATAFLFASCGGNDGAQNSEASDTTAAANSNAAVSSEWVSLFDGKSFAGW